MLTDQRGAAVLDSIVGIAILMLMTTGVIQVALAVYANNAVRASTYEAARAAAVVGGIESEAHSVARRALERTAGGLVGSVSISLSYRAAPEGRVVVVEVVGRQRPPGPVPIELPLRASASALVEQVPE